MLPAAEHDATAGEQRRPHVVTLVVGDLADAGGFVGVDQLLYLLAEKPGKVFKRDEILHKVWGNDVLVGERTIDVHIRKIRERLDGRYIKTIKGIGYKLEF